jgi:excinuclease ABC subunit C
MGVAKGRARRAGHEQLIMGERTVVPGPAHPASHLVQQVRDHAHRLAITRHRKRRQKTAHHSVLESIEGVGAVRRRRLLDHFGGLQGLRQASAEDLVRVPGISPALAERIQKCLQDGPAESH